jgi:hypothetical protein
MRKEFEADEEEAKRLIGQDTVREEVVLQDREQMRVSRQADNGPETTAPEAGSRKTLRGHK